MEYWPRQASQLPMEQNQTIRAIWSYRWWILLAAVCAAIASYFWSQSQTKTYRANALAQVIAAPQLRGDFVDDVTVQSITNLYAQLAETREVMRDARRRTGLDVDQGLFEDRVEVGQAEQPGVLEFIGRSSDPKRASVYANAYIDAFIAYVRRREENRRSIAIEGVEDRIREIDERLEDLSPRSPEALTLRSQQTALQQVVADEIIRPGDAVELIEPAEAPTDAESPKPKRNAALAFLAMLVLGSALAYLRTLLGDRYHSVEEVTADTGLPLLAEVPRSDASSQPAVEAFRGLRTSVSFALRGRGQAPISDGGGIQSFEGTGRRADDKEGRAILVTSPEVGTGKSFVAANLARALAADGSRVAAIDGDLRRPTLHQHLLVPLESGLGDLLSTESSGRVNVLAKDAPMPAQQKERGGELKVVTAGKRLPDAVERLSSARMAETMGAFRAVYDYVVVDSPPAAAIVDAVVLARYADGIVLVIDSRRSRRRTTRRTIQTLTAIGVPILGFVFNSSESIGTSGSGEYFKERQTLVPGAGRLVP